MYDCAIIGGGLAGLSLAILLAKKDLKVIVFEQKTYPFHRVCGEYIAMESKGFLENLGVNLNRFNLPEINQLMISAPDGYYLEQAMNPGGFGISRYTLDEQLAKLAKKWGVEIKENCRVKKVQWLNPDFQIESTQNNFKARIACGSFGKYSNIDLQLRPQSMPHQQNKITFVGIKYHIKTRFPSNLVALHNFKGGYCGISEIEEGKNCLCYMVRSDLLKEVGGKIKQLEKDILCQNPYLDSIFKHATFLFEKPEVISQIHFKPRSLIAQHVLMVGDASGVIPPLCGNGMSMAFRGSQILSALIKSYLNHDINQQELESAYVKQWNQQFHIRLGTGHHLQNIFGHKLPTSLFLRILSHTPGLSQLLIRATHGQPF